MKSIECERQDSVTTYAADKCASNTPQARTTFDSDTHLPLVRKIARRIARGLPAHVPFEDLVAAGAVGLVEALDRFDPNRPTRFEAFAEFRIRGAILDELRRYDFVARNARAKVRRIQHTTRELTASLGHPPTEEEVARALEMKASSLRRLLQRVRDIHPLSLDALGTTGTPFEPAANDSGPEEWAARGERYAQLRAALGRLTPRKQSVVEMYYHREMTMKQIGEALGVSESRVCQILRELTRTLRTELAGSETCAA